MIACYSCLSVAITGQLVFQVPSLGISAYASVQQVPGLDTIAGQLSEMNRIDLTNANVNTLVGISPHRSGVQSRLHLQDGPENIGIYSMVLR